MSKPYKRNNSLYYWVAFTGADGKRIQKSTGFVEKKLAEDYLIKLKNDQMMQKRFGIKPRHKWLEVVERWKEEKHGLATFKELCSKLELLKPFLGSLYLDEINQDVLRSIKLFLLKGRKEDSVNKYLQLIRSILIMARDDWEWLEKCPKVKLFPVPKGRVRFLSVVELPKLLGELPPHVYDLALVSVCTGLRKSNMCQLQWSHLDSDYRHAFVDADEAKGGKGIPVPINDTARQVIMRQIGKHPEYVFTYQGNPIKDAGSKAWRSALKRAGIEDFRWHDLRHTWATLLRQQGASIPELQEMGGWASSAMPNRYAHFYSGHLQGVALKLDAVLGSYIPATLREIEVLEMREAA